MAKNDNRTDKPKRFGKDHRTKGNVNSRGAGAGVLPKPSSGYVNPPKDKK